MEIFLLLIFLQILLSLWFTGIAIESFIFFNFFLKLFPCWLSFWKYCIVVILDKAREKSCLFII